MKPILFSGAYIWPNGIYYVADESPNYVRFSTVSYPDSSEALSAIDKKQFEGIPGFSLPGSYSASLFNFIKKRRSMPPDVPDIEEALSQRMLDNSDENNRWVADQFIKHVIDPLFTFSLNARKITYWNVVNDFRAKLAQAMESNQLQTQARLDNRVGNDGAVLLWLTA